MLDEVIEKGESEGGVFEVVIGESKDRGVVTPVTVAVDIFEVEIEIGEAGGFDFLEVGERVSEKTGNKEFLLRVDLG